MGLVVETVAVVEVAFLLVVVANPPSVVVSSSSGLTGSVLVEIVVLIISVSVVLELVVAVVDNSCGTTCRFLLTLLVSFPALSESFFLVVPMFVVLLALVIGLMVRIMVVLFLSVVVVAVVSLIPSPRPNARVRHPSSSSGLAMTAGGRAVLSRAEQGRAGQSRTELGRAGQSWAGLLKHSSNLQVFCIYYIYATHNTSTASFKVTPT